LDSGGKGGTEACTGGALILTNLDSGNNGGIEAYTGGALILANFDSGDFFGFLVVPIATYLPT
jgi:hypothetical protein